MIKTVWLLFIVLACLQVTHAQQTKVYLIPTIHSMHKTNQQYNYDSVRAVVGRTGADVIAVEIRPEDIAADTSYLKQNYPYEMWMMRYWYPTATIAGFDWLGEDIEKVPIPPNYWKLGSYIKQMERNLHADSAYNEMANRCQVYINQRLPILQNSTLKGIYNSADAFLIKEYYNCLSLQLQNTKYSVVPEFYERRNNILKERIGTILKENSGKTITILTGDDHAPYIREFLQKQAVVLLQP